MIRKNKYILYLLLAIISTSLMVSTYLMAWSWRWHWHDANATINLLPLSFPEGSNYNTLAKDAMRQWNTVGGSRFRFNPRTRYCIPMNPSDNMNCVSFLPELPFPGGVLAITGRAFIPFTNDLYDTDIAFDADHDWVGRIYRNQAELNPNGYQGKYNFHGVLMHELGHCLSLEHQENLQSIMVPYYNTAFYTLWVDDINGIRDIYHGGGSTNNLVVSNWKPDGQRLVPMPALSSPYFLPGDQVSVENHVESRGTDQVTARLGFYLSPNNIITTSDRLLGQVYFNFPPGSSGDYIDTLTIPNDVTAGTYYLGFFLDDTNAVNEYDESDNALAHYQPIEIRSGVIRVPQDYPTIQAAVDAAYNRVLISVSPGTYVENISILNKNITIRSTNGPEATIIDGDGADTVVRIYDCSAGAVIDGFTISNGNGWAGGGIDVGSSLTTIKNCIITENTANVGGGILVGRNSVADIINTTITNNSAISAGGGVYALYNPWLGSGETNLRNCIVWANTAPEYPNVCPPMYPATANYSDIQGGWFDSGVIGNLDIDPLFVDPNAGDYHLQSTSPCINAGDPYSSHDPDGTRADMGVFSYFRSSNGIDIPVPGPYGNTIQAALNAAASGDRILVSEGTYNETLSITTDNITLESVDSPAITIINGHQSDSAVKIINAQNVMLQGFTITNGDAEFGGGIFSANSSPTIKNCIIRDNAANYGGGIYFTSNSFANIINNTIVENYAPHNHGGGIYSASSVWSDSLIQIDNSIIWNNDWIEIFPRTLPIVIKFSDIKGGWSGVNIIDRDPLFSNPSKGNYSLQEGSPCIDTGDPYPWVDYDPDGTRSDMGALFFDHRPRSCFLSGTAILMADGNTKPIEKVKVGDKIIAFDEKTGKFKKDKVVKFYEHETDKYLVVNGHLKVTENHPVYSDGKWVEIGKLKIGDNLLNAQGKFEAITSIKEIKDDFL